MEKSYNSAISDPHSLSDLLRDDSVSLIDVSAFKTSRGELFAPLFDLVFYEREKRCNRMESFFLVRFSLFSLIVNHNNQGVENWKNTKKNRNSSVFLIEIWKIRRNKSKLYLSSNLEKSGKNWKTRKNSWSYSRHVLFIYEKTCRFNRQNTKTLYRRLH